MKRGRKPKPTALKLLTGAFEKDPQRRNRNEPTPSQKTPRCPAYLDAIAKAEWRYMTKVLADLRLLTMTDRAALELYCHTYSEWRKACEQVAKYGAVLIRTFNGKTEAKRNPFDVVRERNATQMARMLQEFGLTPSSRTRIEVAKPSTQQVDSRKRG